MTLGSAAVTLANGFLFGSGFILAAAAFRAVFGLGICIS